MGNTITCAELAEEAGKLSFSMTGWIHEVLNSRERWNDPAQAEMVAAFLASVRERLDHIEARASVITSDTPRS